MATHHPPATTRPDPWLVAETSRLRIRRLVPNDAAFMLRLLNTPGFLSNIGDRGVRTLDDARRHLEAGALASYAVHGYGPFGLELRATGSVVGMCGLFRKPWLEAPDLGYAMLPQAEGMGLASEAARAVVEFAWRSLGLDRLLAVVVPDNAASMRVLAKLGFRRKAVVSDPAADTSLVLLELARTAEPGDRSHG